MVSSGSRIISSSAASLGRQKMHICARCSCTASRSVYSTPKIESGKCWRSQESVARRCHARSLFRPDCLCQSPRFLKRCLSSELFPDPEDVRCFSDPQRQMNGVIEREVAGRPCPQGRGREFDCGLVKLQVAKKVLTYSSTCCIQYPGKHTDCCSAGTKPRTGILGL